MLDLLLQELLPFLIKILFSALFSVVFWDIDLKFVCEFVLT